MTDFLSPEQAVVLAAVYYEWRQTGRATVRSVMARTPLTSPASVQFHLDSLQRLGLVAKEAGRRGTLRPGFIVRNLNG